MSTVVVFSHFSFLARLREKNKKSREKSARLRDLFLKSLEDFLHNSTSYFCYFKGVQAKFSRVFKNFFGGIGRGFLKIIIFQEGQAAPVGGVLKKMFFIAFLC